MTSTAPLTPGRSRPDANGLPHCAIGPVGRLTRTWRELAELFLRLRAGHHAR
jgi:hypothetical protein